jgi:two-component system sensor histidine kinase UhpB
MSDEAIRVLLVEDNSDQARLIEAILQGMHPGQFWLAHAPRLSVARQMIPTLEPQLILLDLQLPDSTGLETLRGAREAAPYVPIVVMTGTDDQGLALEAVRQGAQDYLVKGNYDGNLLARSIIYSIERSRITMELKAAEEEYRSLVRNIPDLIWRADQSGRCHFVSPNVVRFWGYTPEEVYQSGETLWFQKIDPKDRERVRNAYRDLFSNGSPFEVEYRLQKRDGSWIWVRGRSLGTHERHGVLFADGVCADITRHKESEEALKESQRQLQTLSSRLMEVQEAERRNIARELHDEIGQLLTCLKLGLEVCPRLPPEAASSKLSEVQELVRDLITKVSDLSLGLRPPMLDDLGLLPAICWLCERCGNQTGVDVALDHSGFDQGGFDQGGFDQSGVVRDGLVPGGCGGAGIERRLPSALKTAAYRIVQESLSNVARHAGIKQAAVALRAGRNWLEVEVEDRGTGFDLHAAMSSGRSGGLLGMRERALLLGGCLSIQTRRELGTRVKATLPFGEEEDRIE